jgi:2-polyprenyl-6-methoxyphenol hydroxylase-like FAD-dependent oxidoreductase
MLLRQSDVEVVLSEMLAGRGVRVERGVELVDLDQKGAPVTALVRSATGQEMITCQYLAGCDGASSTVRERAGIAWQGGPYSQEVLLADVELAAGLAPGLAHVVAERAGLVFLFPLGERAVWRMLATRAAIGEDIPFGQFGLDRRIRSCSVSWPTQAWRFRSVRSRGTGAAVDLGADESGHPAIPWHATHSRPLLTACPEPKVPSPR